MKIRKFIVLMIVFLQAGFVNAQETTEKVSTFRDSLDNAIDISNFLLNKKGFLIAPSFITEPAVGYGAIGAAIYFHSSYSKKNGPPSMTGVVGGGTQNGTWMAGAFHVGYWNKDRIRYMGALARTYVNVGFYGSGNQGLTEGESVNLNMDAWLVLQQIKFRIAETNFFVGGRYVYFDTYNTFEVPIEVPEFEGIEFSSTLSEAAAMITYDSRNNIFSPTKGFFIELSGSYSDTWMGGDGLYGRIATKMIGYVPAGKNLVLGIRHESTYSLGDIPFYARPMIVLRGAPLMKYQNTNTTVMEAEVDWNLYKRWNLVGFTGMGNAFSSFDEFNEGKSVASIGTGFRYLLARKFGLQMGMDFAKSTDDFAFYIVFGTSWMR